MVRRDCFILLTDFSFSILRQPELIVLLLHGTTPGDNGNFSVRMFFSQPIHLAINLWAGIVPNNDSFGLVLRPFSGLVLCPFDGLVLRPFSGLVFRPFDGLVLRPFDGLVLRPFKNVLFEFEITVR